MGFWVILFYLTFGTFIITLNNSQNDECNNLQKQLGTYTTILLEKKNVDKENA